MKSLLVCLLLVALATAAPTGLPKFMRGRGRIVGGTDVAPGEIPFQISLQDTNFGMNFHFCGGAVYTEEWMITAGHCVAGENFEHPTNLRIVAGDNDLSKTEGTEQAVAVILIIRHEDYDDIVGENDVALLRVKSPLIFGDYVQGVTLPEQLQDSTGQGTVSGWGTTTEGGSSPHILQVATVPIVSDAVCRDAYEESNPVFDSMMCAGAEGLDACQGDSGGPMICTSGGSTYLCGIVSWGYGCARPNFPGVYTEVSYFVDWIQTNSATLK